MNVDEITETLEELILEKSEALNTVNIAVNEWVNLKNEYITPSNKLRLNPEVIKENLGLSKAPTEKQTQAYIDNELSDLVQDMLIADENIKSWKREVDLLNDKIQLEKYRVKMLMEDYIK